MRTIHTLFSKILIVLIAFTGLAQAQERNTNPGHRAEMMPKPLGDMEDLGLQTVMFNEDSCFVDTVMVMERYSDHLEIRIHPAPDSAEYRIRLIDTIDPAEMVHDSLWTTGGVSDTCCFSIDGLTESSSYAVQARIWCPDDQQFLSWSDVLYDTTRCPAPTDPAPTSSFNGSKATMVFDVVTDAWEWVLQEEGSATAKHVITDVNHISWRIDPGINYLWKVRVKCGDDWSDYTSDQDLQSDPDSSACQEPGSDHFNAYDISHDQVSLHCNMKGSQYIWGIKAQGSSSWKHVTTDSPHHTWDGLESSTKYEYKVQVECGNGKWSGFSHAKYFNTGDHCDTPGYHHMEAKDVGYETATTYCHMKGTEYHWYIRPHHSNYGWKDITDYKGHYKWEGLRHNTKYEYKVKVKCHDGHWSKFSPTMYFTTHDKYDKHCYDPGDHHVYAKNISYQTASTYCDIKGYSYHWFLRPYGSKDWTKHYEGPDSYHHWKNLDYGTKYEYKVKVKCHSGYWTDFSPIKYFTTHKHDPCHTPDAYDLSASDITYNSAITHCAVKGYSYHWFLRKKGSYNWDKHYEGPYDKHKWTGLDYGTKYEYKVKVKCHDGHWSEFSPIKHFVTKDHYSDYCTTPLAQHLSTDQIGYDKATTHCGIKGEKYHWQIRAWGSHGDWKHYSGPDPHHGWTGLHYDTKYEYKVKVQCHSGYWTSWSPTKYFTTHKHHDPCYTPSSHHLSHNKVTYNSASTYCDVKGSSYHWYMKEAGASNWDHHVVSHSHYDWKGLKYGTKYEYKVKVLCYDGHWTTFSPVKYFTTQDHYDCYTPSSHHVSHNNLSYNSATTHCDVKGTSYHWYMREVGTNSWKHHVVSHNHYNWKDLKYGTKYEYKVKVLCHNGHWTTFSPVKYLTTHDHYGSYCTTPTSYHLSTKDIAYNTATTHCAVQGSSYHWYIRPHGSHTWLDYQGSSPHHTWKDLKYGTKYEYMVKVKCSNGWTGWSPHGYFTTHDHYADYCSAPGPYDFTAIQINWDEFHIYLYSPNVEWMASVRPPGMDWWTHQTTAQRIGWGNLDPNTQYQYRVKRKCHDGTWSDWSNIKTFWTGVSTGRPAGGSVSIIDDVHGEVIQLPSNGKGEVNIFPSPASDFITIEGDVLPGSAVKILNLQGQTVHQHLNAYSADRINVQGLQPGVYQTVITMTDGSVQTKKLMVVH